MKDQFFIINPEGLVFPARRYLKSAGCSELMRVCIAREVLGLPMAKAHAEPEYLKYARKLGFDWEDNSGPGFINYNYKADLMRRLVEGYARKLVNNIGMPVFEVKGANFFNIRYPVVEAYAKLFGDRLFRFNGEDEELVMSYDASYPQFNLARKAQLGEKHLPFAHFSLSDCYRYEQSGECMLLLRGRRFFMPDLHPYFKDPAQAWEGYFAIEKQLNEGFKLAGRQYVNIAKVSSRENWERYRREIVEIAKRGDKELLVQVKMDGADRYWIVDVDYSIVDKAGQVREIGCIQIDVGNAKRLGIRYQDSKGERRHPVIIHAAVPGGIERYLYMLFDDFKCLPLGFAPVQVRLIPVGENFHQAAQEIAKAFPALRIEIDERAESVSKKIKSAHRDLVPHILVIGQQEMEPQNLMALKARLKELEAESSPVPFCGISWPRELSRQV